MALTFSDTHNMIAFLTKSDASEGFDQIIYFLNASSIKYALTVNPNIYVSVIKQFWSFVAVKKVNDVPRIQALVDKKKVIITEATIRDVLRLDDVESIECLPNEEIFTELARMGDEKPFTKLIFYKVFFSKTPLFEGMIVAQQVGEGDDEVNVEDVPAAGNEGAASVNDDDVPAAVDELSILSPTPSTQPPPTSQDVPSTSHDVVVVAKDVKDAEIKKSSDVQGRKAESQAKIYQIDLGHADKVLSMQDDDIVPAELQEVVEVVTIAKLITEVVTATSVTITAAVPQLTTAAAPTLTTTLSAARRRKEVVIKDPKETATPSFILKPNPKTKGKRFWYQALKRKPQTEAQAKKNMMIYLRNMAGFKMDYFKGMKYDDIRQIFEKYFNSNVAFLEKTKEKIEEEDSRAFKRINESQKDKAAKKQKIDNDVEELRKHLQIVPNNNDDVYIEATPLALKVPVVDYDIHTENNKPYYKIKRVNRSYQLYLSFVSILRNFDSEDLEVLWQLVKQRFTSSKPKNFLDDFLLTALGAISAGVKGPTVLLLPVAPDLSSGELEASVDKLFDEGGSGKQADQGDSTCDGHGVGVQLVDGSAETIAEDVAPAELQRRKKRKTKVVDAGEPSHSAKKLKGDYRAPVVPAIGGKSQSAVQCLLAGVVHHAEVRGRAMPTLPFVSSSVSTTLDHEGGDCTKLLAGANLQDEVDSVVRTSVPIMTNATTYTPTDDLAAIAKEKLVSASVFGGDSSSAGRSHPISGGISDCTGGDFLVRGIPHQISLGVKDECVRSIALRRKGEAAEAVRLYDEAHALKERNTYLEKEKIELEIKVTDLATSVKVHKLEVASSGFQEKLSHYENLIERHGSSPEGKVLPLSAYYYFWPPTAPYPWHGTCYYQVHTLFLGRTLADVAAYNPFAEADYFSALQQDNLTKRLGLTELQPCVDQLMVPIHHSLDRVVIGATSLSFVLDVSDVRVRKIKENITSQRPALRDVFTPISEPFSAEVLTGTRGTSDTVPAPITMALSVTSISASAIPPISTDDYEIAHTEGREDDVANVEAVVDEGADPFPNVSGTEPDV
nr:hypothetical protein [Tanacetum cinerariifolium]